MNNSIENLTQIASKDQKLIIGLMSGTSLDGIDIALCRVTGTGVQTKLQLKEFRTIGYPPELSGELKDIAFEENVSLQKVCQLHSRLADYHANLILRTLQTWDIKPSEVDCIASHGQSIYHYPASLHHQPKQLSSTLQIIDGDHIARKTGILTLSDFRQKHTAAGGEGAPLVSFADQLLFTHSANPRILLNIGGIANFTCLPPHSGQSKYQHVTTDTGPGNTLINQAMQELFNKPFDENGATAKEGSVQSKLLNTLLGDSFFSLPLPRTTGPELFNLPWARAKQQESNMENIAKEDFIATLTRFSAQTIADAIHKVDTGTETEIFISGGGMYNKQLIEWLEELLAKKVHSFSDIGFNPDAKEAACFTVLANETLSGEPFTIDPDNGTEKRVNFGKISLPV